MNETGDPDKVRYLEIHANPGFLKCQRPECENARGVRSWEVYSHAWEKHRTNDVSIQSQKNQEQQE